MSRFGVEFGQGSVIFELATLDKNLLSVWFDAGEGEQLVFQGFAVGRGIEIDLIALAGVFDDDWSLLVGLKAMINPEDRVP